MWFTPLLAEEAQPSGSTVAHSSGHYRTGGRGLVVQWAQASPEVTPATARPTRGWDVRVLRDSRVQLPQRRAGTASGVEIPVGLATETDTAYALTGATAGTVGLAVEADSAYSRTGSMSGAAGLAVETDSAYARSGAMTGAAGLAIETDEAFALPASMPGAAGLATETDTAFALGGVMSGAAGLATEADNAFALSAGTALPVGLAVETDSAYALAGAMAGAVGLATETDTAFALEVSSSTIRRPNSDILTTGWTAVPGGSLYDMIDEASPNDADYITRAQAGTEPAIFGIPQVPAGPNTIRIRAAATSGSGQVRVLLLDSSGSTVGTSAWQSIDATPTTYALSVVASATAERVRIEAS